MNATAFRAWQAQEILACELVTGDIVVTEEDTTAPADYITGCECSKAYAVVTVTARQTFVGKTAAFVQGANDSAHSKAIVDYMGGTFLILVMFWIVAAWIGDDGNWVMSVAAIASNHNVKNLGPIDKATIPHPPPVPQGPGIVSRNWVTEKYTPFDPSATSAPTVLPRPS
ncbi:hypothetical protein ACMYSQ_012339 [Aspergillus niger]